MIFLDVEALGTDPFSSPVIAIGTLEEKERIYTAESGEKRLLEEFLADLGTDIVVGLGVRRFDIPLLILRCLKYELNASKLLRLKIIDLEEVLSLFYEKKKRLDDWMRFLGKDGKFELVGYLVPQWYEQGDWEKIVAHLRDDLRKTKLLYDALEKAGIIEFLEKQGRIPTPLVQ